MWDNSSTDPIFHGIDYTGDLILVIDIFLNFRTTFISGGIEIIDPLAIGMWLQSAETRRETARRVDLVEQSGLQLSQGQEGRG